MRQECRFGQIGTRAQKREEEREVSPSPQGRSDPVVNVLGATGSPRASPAVVVPPIEC